MENNKNQIVKDLLETGAVKIAGSKNPFFYTSGTIGPYFINTQNLFGSEEEANELLLFIDEALKEGDKHSLPVDVYEKLKHQYDNNDIYRRTIDQMVRYIRDNDIENNVEYISGGERRDWFFAPIIAAILDKPYITIYKDLDAVMTENIGTENALTHEAGDINGASVLHITDLVTEASSFVKSWIPAISKINGEIDHSLAVVDRMQNGSKVLTENDIVPHSLVNIEPEFFNELLSEDLIDGGQNDMLTSYYKDPSASMRTFLLENPNFIEGILLGDNSKNADRARKLVSENPYDLEFDESGVVTGATDYSNEDMESILE